LLKEIIFGIIGGLALFLFGLKLLSEGMQRVAGDRLKKALEFLTDRTYKGIATGAVVTAVIQSSSITTVTLLGLINAGLLTLEQAVGVIVGANIGTTVTAQIVAFPIGKYALVLIGVGFFLMAVAKNEKVRSAGEALLGLGILFLGMNIMKGGVKPLRNAPFMVDMLLSLGTVPILGILAGAAFTGIIQSSSATTALVIAMGMDGLLSLSSAVPIILGANIGTCITALIASIGSSLSSRRAAVHHLFFNLIWVAAFFIPLPYFIKLVKLTSDSLPRQIANAHTLFNVIGTVIVYPFLEPLIRFVKFIVPGEVVTVERGTKFIDKRLLSTPSIALANAEKDVVRMAQIAHGMISDSKKIFLNDDKKLIKVVAAKENSIDEIEKILDAYMTLLSEKALQAKERGRLAGFTHAITDIERVGDHLNNIVELAARKVKAKVKFSPSATQNLKAMFEGVEKIFGDTVRALEGEDGGLIKSIFDQEGELDRMEKEFEAAHMSRMDQNQCDPHAGVIFVDVLRNLERIGDHSDNIAHMLLVGF